MIPPDVQHMFAERMNATTLSLNTSHASYVSHPNEIAELILNATKGSKARLDRLKIRRKLRSVIFRLINKHRNFLYLT